MRRSMDDVGATREEDEIQQAIRLSLQELGMSYNHENQVEEVSTGLCESISSIHPRYVVAFLTGRLKCVFVCVEPHRPGHG